MLKAMHTERIAELLRPYVGAETVGEETLNYISIYIDILTKWNARMNLTAVRAPEDMVRRHFGESLFAASRLLERDATGTAIDVGSGAGFPGMPLKLWAPGIRMTLIESHSKKATFLREAVRALRVSGVEVFDKRAEDFTGKAGLVTLRAVEKFEVALPVAGGLVEKDGKLAILIGSGQVEQAQRLLPGFQWEVAVPIPESQARVVLVGHSGE